MRMIFPCPPQILLISSIDDAVFVPGEAVRVFRHNLPQSARLEAEKDVIGFFDNRRDIGVVAAVFSDETVDPVAVGVADTDFVASERIRGVSRERAAHVSAADETGSVSDNIRHLFPYLVCPFPRTVYLYDVSSRRPIGPLACIFCVDIPISQPSPNSPPSVNLVEAL